MSLLISCLISLLGTGISILSAKNTNREKTNKAKTAIVINLDNSGTVLFRGSNKGGINNSKINFVYDISFLVLY